MISPKIERPTGNYIVLESMLHEKNSSRMFHVMEVNSSNHEFKMGRGHESGVRVNDISVSRVHAIIKFKDGDFYVSDNNSKFGTLVLAKENIRLNLCYTLAV